MTRRLYLVAAALLVAMSTARADQERVEPGLDKGTRDQARGTPRSIEIKGIYIGMPEEELHKKGINGDSFGEGTESGPRGSTFTIAGVSGGFLGPSLEYRDGKLDKFEFTFESADFQRVLDAVRHKYPQLACNTSALMNRHGARYQQINCSMTDGKSNLYLCRYDEGQLNWSSLTLVAKRRVDDQIKRQKERKKDI
jgi:hypothetical protein